MRRTPHIIGLIFMTLLFCAATCPAAENFRATLEVSDQPGALPPFLPVELTLQTAASGAHWINLQDTLGGPVYQYPANLSADQPETLTVYLPPLAPSQTYRVWLDAASPENTIETTAELAWPAEKVQPEFFFNPAAYAPFRYDLPAWPQSMIWRAISLGVVLCLALWAILLIRRPGWRAFCFVLILLAAGAYMLLTPRPEMLIRETHGDLLVLRSRRTCAFSSNDPRLIPQYITENQFERDKTTIRFSPQPAIETMVEPEQARIFRIRAPFEVSTSRPQPETDPDE